MHRGVKVLIMFIDSKQSCDQTTKYVWRVVGDEIRYID